METTESIGQWALETFGAGNVRSLTLRLLEETLELCESVNISREEIDEILNNYSPKPNVKNIRSELGDCNILLHILANTTGKKLHELTDIKMAINRKRIWKRNGKHIKTITLCGSSRFKDEFIKVQRELTLQGHIVITVGLEGLDMNGEKKKMLDELHLHKIDMSDEIFVINPEGYIGESTRKEIDYAISKNKIVKYLYENQ